MGPIEISRFQHLDQSDLEAVEHLVDAAAAADGVRPLDEHATLALRSSAAGIFWLARSAGELLGFARIAPAEAEGHDAGLTADLVVHPDQRRRGLGDVLLTRLLTHAEGEQLRLWAHGSHPGATRLAAAHGLVPARELWRMRRPLLGPEAAPLPDFPVPDGVAVRTFVPGVDEAGLLAANAAAFADHPEQGGMTLADLRTRMAQPWFDPAGLFVAETSGQIVGFHWTKEHQPPVRGERSDVAVGEIYVLGVDPVASASGALPAPGLGKALAVIGLRHLTDRGLAVAMLYTEADNAKAVHLYEKLGFARADVDQMFARSDHPPEPGSAGAHPG